MQVFLKKNLLIILGGLSEKSVQVEYSAFAPFGACLLIVDTQGVALGYVLIAPFGAQVLQVMSRDFGQAGGGKNFFYVLWMIFCLEGFLMRLLWKIIAVLFCRFGKMLYLCGRKPALVGNVSFGVGGRHIVWAFVDACFDA